MPSRPPETAPSPLTLPKTAGGFRAIWYTLKQARAVGGLWRMWSALRSPNACKTCALGMGGQSGGMVNEQGRFPEVCKKSIQAMAADMRGRIRDGFFDEFKLPKLARLSPRELEAAGRITQPMFAAPGDDRYRPISWDEAITRICAKLRAITPDEAFFYASGRSSNEAGFLLQLFSRLYGTNNVNNCSFFCHQASGVALKPVIGAATGTVVLDDLEHADLVFLIGANPASNHPRLMRTLMDLKRRGGRIVVINPLREIGLVNFSVPSDPFSLLLGTPIADLYLQPHIGGDIALLSALAKATIEAHADDPAYVQAHTLASDAWRAQLDALDWPTLCRESGVDEPAIRRAAELYASSKAAIFCWTMGITHHQHGVANVHAISNLALLRGMVGRPGAGLLPLRGHSNVQGLGTIGVSPTPSDAFLDRLNAHFGVTLPRIPGLDTLGSIQAADAERVRFALHLGGNLFGSSPDAAMTARALSKIDLTVFLSTTLNTGHAHGRGRESLILPVLARDEEPQATTQESMFSFVRLSDGGPARFDGPRSEVDILAAIARGTLGPRLPVGLADMESHASLRLHMSRVIPDLAQLGSIDGTRNEFQIPGRARSSPRFATPTGRASFVPVPLPVVAPEVASGAQFRLMTIRSEGQFNTIVYEDEDIYRAQTRRDVILMNIDDLDRLGLRENDRVVVSSSAGSMEVTARRAEIRAGNAAMYYPEANVLVPARVDAGSGTPAFKNIPVTVRRSGALPVLRGV